MSVSKRLRFEIFRRDSHSCRYCGATASNTKLTIDHVTPVALGGSDEPSNLVTACRDCNSGKTSSSPDAPFVADVAQDALRWARAQQAAAQQMLRQFETRSIHHRAFEERWNQWPRGGQAIALPGGWEHSVDNFVAAGLPVPILLDCIDKAMPVNRVANENVFRYACGIAWNLVASLQEETRHLVDANLENQKEDAIREPNELANLLLGYLDISHDDELREIELKTRISYQEDGEQPNLSSTEWGVLGAIGELADKASTLENAASSLLLQLSPETLKRLRQQIINELSAHLGNNWSQGDLLSYMIRSLQVIGARETEYTYSYIVPSIGSDPWTVD
ncbi:HNH endonuclease [Kutzneria albida]|uniref:HNH nuclease domain-containing protein n=1 Tax=Kutzneria albida DSM 43870 TaxID=1449976 RepID=W5WCH6_9PSEU|nr:HNH endonuclease signature motif containing protein [Kutzneria albida]AHH98231.1 hypothetical protein KALB_4869 [Kutzneria albida DSM 43870]